MACPISSPDSDNLGNRVYWIPNHPGADSKRYVFVIITTALDSYPRYSSPGKSYEAQGGRGEVRVPCSSRLDDLPVDVFRKIVYPGSDQPT
ncbi:OLC1v1020873C1 [Oldenlandia corymbosa var. corymbosa]|uniref:OLC1v1020873C1 n=1 Tax=Oldenlandia corymbosa var. corymbosa TaxID=529605 RepID=A0AAV1BUE9_OLDCO|nr:OLC1v1020873C1 [Oldenlandia corymbosa var. corymbosa]